MLKNNILKQRNIGMWWGAVRNLGSSLTFYLTFVNFVLLLMSWYMLVNPELQRQGIIIPFFAIVVVAVTCFVVALILEHKFTLPSYFTYWNSQWYAHGNLLKNRLDERDKELDERYKQLKKQLDRIEEALKEKTLNKEDKL